MHRLPAAPPSASALGTVVGFPQFLALIAAVPLLGERPDAPTLAVVLLGRRTKVTR